MACGDMRRACTRFIAAIISHSSAPLVGQSSVQSKAPIFSLCPSQILIPRIKKKKKRVCCLSAKIAASLGR